MYTPTVYLAGPILGLNSGEANDWRIYMHRRLIKYGIVGISPLRCEPLKEGHERYTFGNDADPKFGTARAIASKNFYDVQRCDMTLAFLPDPGPGKDQSWGTLSELAWAKALSKPTVI